jgi:hypothetical protein
LFIHPLCACDRSPLLACATKEAFLKTLSDLLGYAHTGLVMVLSVRRALMRPLFRALKFTPHVVPCSRMRAAFVIIVPCAAISVAAFSHARCLLSCWLLCQQAGGLRSAAENGLRDPPAAQSYPGKFALTPCVFRLLLSVSPNFLSAASSLLGLRFFPFGLRMLVSFPAPHLPLCVAQSSVLYAVQKLIDSHKKIVAQAPM